MKVKSLNTKKKLHNLKDIKLRKKSLFCIKISDKIHSNFIKFSGDDSPIHTSLKFVKKNDYKKKMGHGFLITTILSQIFGKYLPGGSELCIKQECNFKKPFFVGDTLDITLIPIKKNYRFNYLEIETVIKVRNIIIFSGLTSFVLSLK